MRYYKVNKDGYIIAIGTGNGNTEISETEYNEILNVVQNKPKRTETTDYRLKEDMTWEEVEAEPIPEAEPTDEDKAEAYDILMGEQE